MAPLTVNIVNNIISDSTSYCLIEENDIKFVKIKPSRYLQCFRSKDEAIKIASVFHKVINIIKEYKSITDNKSKQNNLIKKVEFDLLMHIYIKENDGSVVSESEEDECPILTEEFIKFEKQRSLDYFTLGLYTQDNEEDSDYSKVVFTFVHSNENFHKIIDYLHNYYMNFSQMYRTAYEIVSNETTQTINTIS